MKPRLRVARITKCEIKRSKMSQKPYVSVKFYLLEPYNFKGHRVHRIWASLSSNPQAAWKVIQFLKAVDATTINEFPDRRLLGRYCKLLIKEESYEERTLLRIAEFKPINPHIMSKEEIEELRKEQEAMPEEDHEE